MEYFCASASNPASVPWPDEQRVSAALVNPDKADPLRIVRVPTREGAHPTAQRGRIAPLT